MLQIQKIDKILIHQHDKVNVSVTKLLLCCGCMSKNNQCIDIIIEKETTSNYNCINKQAKQSM